MKKLGIFDFLLLLPVILSFCFAYGLKRLQGED